MKNITQNAAHIAASKTLNDLSTALNAARLEEARLLDALATTPGASTNPLQAALNVLAGKDAQRTDSTGLNQALDTMRVTIATLTPGLEQQRAVLATLAAELSGQACADAAVTHAKAAQGIADALVALSKAQENETTVRAAIEAAGYRCSLPAMAEPAIEFLNAQSQSSRYRKTCQDYATDTLDAASGALDKPAVVLMLAGTLHGQPGDVVKLDGREARQLVRLGRCEYTTAKPGKAPRAQPARELILS